MSDVIQTAIRQLEQELEANHQRAQQIERALANIRAVLGPVDRPKRRKVARRPRKAKARKVERRAQPKVRESVATMTEDAERIVEALKFKTPQSPRELQKTLRLVPPAFRRRIALLEESGRVTLTGKTASRLVHLAGSAPAGPVKTDTPAKAAKAPKAAPPPPAPDVDEAVAARDAAILARLKAGRATFDELLEAMAFPADLNTVQRREIGTRAIRRLSMRQKIRDVGQYWQLV